MHADFVDLENEFVGNAISSLEFQLNFKGTRRHFVFLHLWVFWYLVKSLTVGLL